MFKRMILIGIFTVPSILLANNSINDQLIEKFRKIRVQLAPSNPSRISVTQRLADLLAERAREKNKIYLSGTCPKPCDDGRTDRLEAITFYKEVMPKINSSQTKSRILLQLGHLYQVTNQASQAKSFYEEILSKSDSIEVKEKALLSLAEMSFKKGEYQKSHDYYKQIVDHKEMQKKSLAAYKMAWSQFYLGNIDTAVSGLKNIITSPRLLQRVNEGSGSLNIDMQFKKEVSKDLAGFLAQKNANLSEAKDLYKKSPKEAALSNISYLASELERLGHRQNSIDVWQFFIKKSEKPFDRLDANLDLANLFLQENNFQRALSKYQNVFTILNAGVDCPSEDVCRILQERLRKFVLSWNKVEKSNPSEGLISSYESYLGHYKEDLSMYIWLAQILKQNKDFTKSYQIYKTAYHLKEKGIEAKEEQIQNMTKESLLLSLIELAEQTKDKDLMLSAYNFYLNESVEKTKETEIRYQIAYQFYEKENYNKAADLLHKLAISQGDASIRTKAADLSLDALAVLKDDKKLMIWSKEYASLLKAGSKSYQAINRKAVLNLSAEKQDSAEEALTILKDFNLDGATKEEKVAFYKNQIILNEKLKRWLDMKVASETLATLKEASEKDKIYAIRKRIWLAELQLDFSTAYKWLQKLPAKERNPFKQALIADLANEDANQFYETYIKSTEDKDEARRIVSYLIDKSKKPRVLLNKYEALLSEDKKLFASLHLNAFANDKDFSSLSALEKANLADSPEAKLMWRLKYLNEIADLKTNLANHQLKTKNQKLLSRSIKKRDALLSKGESLLKSAISKKDWTAQVLALDLLSNHSQRFYQDILSLPLPEGLSAEEQNQYMQILGQQSTPYRIQADEMKEKLKEFWSKAAGGFDRIQANMKGQSQEVQSLLKSEIKALASIANEKHQESLTALLSLEQELQEPTDYAKIDLLRSGVRRDPFNKTIMQELKELEEKAGHTAMASYLEARIEAIKNKAGQSL